MGKFVKKTGKDGQFYFSLNAANGQIILFSEGYTTTASRDNGIESVKRNAIDDSRYTRQTSTSRKPYFTLRATNGQVIGKSQMYNFAVSMEKGIASAKTNAPDASIVDE